MKSKICFILFLLTEIYTVQAQKAYIINDFMKGYTLYFAQQTIKSEIKEYYRLTENESKKIVLEYGPKELSKPQISKTAKTTPFKSPKDIKYTIYETSNSVGIKINVNGKISDWQGVAKKGTLATLSNAKFVNLVKNSLNKRATIMWLFYLCKAS